MSDGFNVSVKGKIKSVSAIRACGVSVLSRGRLVKTAEVFDEYWLERDLLPRPEALIAELQGIKKNKPDLFTFAQRIPNTDPAYNYDYEWINYAALPITTYEQWFQHQVPSACRRNIRASEKRGIIIQVSDYDDNYVRGIMSIYNETPIRAGRKFWHFGKDFATVKRENGTYAERSTYLAAYCQGEMVGYLKIVWDRPTAAIMQILSKTSFRDHKPNNALLAEAVKQCCLKDVKFLLYEKFDYGQKTGDSLTKFKQNNGFIRMDIPRYYVPLTLKGYWALRLGLHHKLTERIPEWIAAPLRNQRTKLYEALSESNCFKWVSSKVSNMRSYFL